MSVPTVNFNPDSSGAVGLNNVAPNILESFRAKKDADELTQWTHDKYKQIKAARSSIERQWYINLSFYFGKQYVNLVSTSSNASGNNFRLYTPQAPPWRVRMVANKVRPIIRTELAKVTAQKPNATVYPASNDDRDIFAARAGEQIYDSLYRRKKMKNVLRRAQFWNLICGNGYIKDWWDPTAFDPDGTTPGDIMIAPETPFHIMVPDFREEEIEDQPYLIHASTKSPEWVRAHYGKALKGININPNTAGATDILENSFLNLVGASQLTKDSVLCLEVWIKPGGHKLFPEGGMFTLLGDTIVQAVGLQNEPWPFSHNQYPFTKFDHIPTGKYYSDSVITDLIPLQKEYNRTRSQIVEAKNRMAKPQLMAYQGSINPSQITTEPGQVILVKQGFQMPMPLRLEPLPQYVIEELNRCQSDMDDISGQHEITKGRVPPGVTAATAISYLQEQDDSKISHTIDSIEDGMEKIANHWLSHVVQFWDVPRIVKVVGNDGSYDAQALKGSDLRGNTDIKVEAGSALPTSKAAKQAYVMDLMKMGFIPPEEGLKVLEFGGVEKLYDEMQQDVRQAQRENLRMQEPDPQVMMAALQAQQTGQPVEPGVPVNSWDTHPVHITTHNKFRKSAAFEQLDDAVKQEFEAHVQQHQAIIAQQYAQQMQMGGAPGAAPGGPPPATPDPSQGQPTPEGQG
jgi:hypothetical protein